MKKNFVLELSARKNTHSITRLKRGFVKHTSLISSFLLSTLFIYAAYNKLAVYQEFIDQLNFSPAIKDTKTIVNWITPILIIGITSLAVYKKTRTRGLWSAFAMMLAYTVYNYIVTPGGYANFLAWFVPGIELLTAVLLLLPKTRLMGLWSSFGLMFAFTIYIYILPHFYAAPGCSCGGIISTLSWKGHFYFNLAFTLLAGLGLSLIPTQQKEKAST